MKYILEGPDGTGKTYYAKHTLKDASYSCENKPPKTLRDIYIGLVNDFAFVDSGEYAHSVKDRSFIISEYIYSRALKRTVYLAEGFVLDFINECNDKGIEVIFFLYLSPLATSKRTLNTADQNLPIEKINDLYYELYKKVGCLFNVDFLCIEDILRGGEI